MALIALFHRAEFASAARLEASPPKVDVNRVLVIRALLATLIMIALFFAGMVPAKAAIIIGGLLLDDDGGDAKLPPSFHSEQPPRLPSDKFRRMLFARRAIF